MSRPTPDYGLDAGAAVRAMFIVGPPAAIGGFLIARWTLSRHLGLAYTLQIFGFCCLILASLMFASSSWNGGSLSAVDTRAWVDAPKKLVRRGLYRWQAVYGLGGVAAVQGIR